eukprot:snap_masked-scaffold_7-processed-gene-19.45-mRNA-1 protein AED:1.00 eAED:1.00 QI:0/0/0/0/1/1/2/0/204
MLTILIVSVLAAVIHLVLIQDTIPFISEDFYLEYAYYDNWQHDVVIPSSASGGSFLQQLREIFKINCEKNYSIKEDYIVKYREFYIAPATVMITWQAICNVLYLWNKFGMCYLVSTIVRAITLLAGILFLGRNLYLVQAEIDTIVEDKGERWVRETGFSDGSHLASIFLAAFAAIMSIVQVSQYCCYRVNNEKRNNSCYSHILD